MNQKNYNKQTGYVLVEVLTSVNIVTVLVLFCVTIISFHVSVSAANQQNQAALYLLERELELFIVQETAVSMAQEYITTRQEQVYTIHEEELRYPIKIELLWYAEDIELANIRATAEWNDGKKINSLQLYSKQKIYFFEWDTGIDTNEE